MIITPVGGTLPRGSKLAPGRIILALDSLMSGVWLQGLESSSDNPDIKYIKAEDIRECVIESYRLRIAELKARWRLVGFRGPFFFTCDGNPSNEVVATFFETDPPSAVLERGDRIVVAFLRPSGSGSRYEGMNVVFWNKGEEAMVVWGWEADTLRCVLRDPPD
jgi:hypothetical protein